MKKFAVIQMGPTYTPEEHRATFQLPNMAVYIRTVRNFAEATACVQELAADGVGCIELCGAFGPAQTRELIECTGGKIAIGYGTHFPEQTEMFNAFFAPPPAL